MIPNPSQNATSPSPGIRLASDEQPAVHATEQRVHRLAYFPPKRQRTGAMRAQKPAGQLGDHASSTAVRCLGAFSWIAWMPELGGAGYFAPMVARILPRCS